MPKYLADMPRGREVCHGPAEAQCKEACERGDRDACTSIAWELQATGDTDDALQAERFFTRGCRLGSAIACTNTAAGMLAFEGTGVASCARRMFEKTCQAKEAFGCGMVGKLLLGEASGVATDLVEGRTVLERACLKLDHPFPCMVLAEAHVSGVFGETNGDEAARLFALACERGNARGCTEVESARAAAGKADGRLAPEKVAAVLGVTGKRVEACQSKAKEQRYSPYGRIELLLRVETNGTVQFVRRHASDMNELVEACLYDLVRGLTFPKPIGGAAHFVWQLELERDETPNLRVVKAVTLTRDD